MKIIAKPEDICKDHYLIKIDSTGSVSAPGQFVNIRIGEQTDPLLRRPFSIHNNKNGILEIVFKVVGKGTRLLRDHLETGEIDIIAPLGNCFTPIDGGRALLIGGGVGNAPLYYLARELKEIGNHITYLYGAKSKDAVFLKEKFKAVSGKFVLATDDGSEGEKGLITDSAKNILAKENFDFIYSCGPEIMLNSVIDLLKNNATPLEVSVENYFGCGIGVCYGCTVETTHGLKRACVDGPVFDGKEIKFNSD